MTALSRFCDLGQLTKPLSAPASSAVRWSTGRFRFGLVASEGTERDRSTVRGGAQALVQVSLSSTPGTSCAPGTGRHASGSPAASPRLEPAMTPCSPLLAAQGPSPGFLSSSRCRCATGHQLPPGGTRCELGALRRPFCPLQPTRAALVGSLGAGRSRVQVCPLTLPAAAPWAPGFALQPRGGVGEHRADRQPENRGAGVSPHLLEPRGETEVTHAHTQPYGHLVIREASAASVTSRALHCITVRP